MHRISTEIYELVIGSIILGLGLIYLTFLLCSSDRLIKIAEEEVLDNEALYQQYSTVDIMLVTSYEIYATIMGTRDYPIIIDNKKIEVEGNDYNLYFSYIKEGTYKKTYNYDRYRNILQIIYQYSGI